MVVSQLRTCVCVSRACASGFTYERGAGTVGESGPCKRRKGEKSFRCCGRTAQKTVNLMLLLLIVSAVATGSERNQSRQMHPNKPLQLEKKRRKKRQQRGEKNITTSAMETPTPQNKTKCSTPPGDVKPIHYKIPPLAWIMLTR